MLPVAAIEHTAHSAEAAAVFVANLFFQATTGGYFDGSSEEMPLLHLWSLSVEEQFYFIWPALLAASLRWRVHPRLMLSLLAVSSFAYAEWLMKTDIIAAFYQMPSRVWELAVGGLLATLPARLLPRWSSWLGLALTVAACFFPARYFPGVGALPAVAGAALLLASIHGGASNALLASRPMVEVGQISYSLYLWHWPLLALYRATVSHGTTATRLLLCLLAVVLAWVSYRFIEKPFRRSKSPRLALASGLVAMVLVASVAFAFANLARPAPADFAAEDFPATRRLCNAEAEDDPSRVDRPGCTTIRRTPARVALWGDSMALAWFPLAVELGRRRGLSATDYSRDACQPFIGIGTAKCQAWNMGVLRRVQTADTVVLAGRWALAYNASSSAGLARTLAALKNVRRVIIIGPTPELRARAPSCLRSGDMEACVISRHAFDQDSAAVRQVLKSVAGRYPNVEYVEAADWLCTPGECGAMKSGMVLYWDTHHISTTAARAYARQFSQ